MMSAFGELLRRYWPAEHLQFVGTVAVHSLLTISLQIVGALRHEEVNAIAESVEPVAR